MELPFHITSQFNRMLRTVGRGVVLSICNVPLMFSVAILIHALSDYSHISPLRLISFCIIVHLIWLLREAILTLITLFISIGLIWLFWDFFQIPNAW